MIKCSSKSVKDNLLNHSEIILMESSPNALKNIFLPKSQMSCTLSQMDGIVILIKTYPWKFHMSSLEHKGISRLFFLFYFRLLIRNFLKSLTCEQAQKDFVLINKCILLWKQASGMLISCPNPDLAQQLKAGLSEIACPACIMYCIDLLTFQTKRFHLSPLKDQSN